MALYQVGTDGKAPDTAKAGDHIVTGGGTYEVLDGSQYQGKSPQELSAMGVGYNPASGLYSKRVTDTSNQNYTANTGSYSQVGANYSSKLKDLVGVSNISYKNYDNVRKMSDAYYDQQVAGLEQNYNTDLARLKKTYNNSMLGYETQKNQVDSDYTANREQLYSDAYYNNKLATQTAASRGLTSSAQGLAMNVGVLAQASQRASELTNNRDKLINDINLNVNRLSSDYNVDRDTLLSNFNAGKLNALSTSELQYMQAALEVDDYNANIWNELVMNKYNNDYQSAETQKDRDFKAAESEKDRALQTYLTRLSLSSRSGGSGSSKKKYDAKYETSLSDVYKNHLKEVYGDDWGTKLLTAEQRRAVDTFYAGIESGYNSAAELETYLEPIVSADRIVEPRGGFGSTLKKILNSGAKGNTFNMSQNSR